MAISASRMAMMPNSKAPPMPPIAAPSGMKVKEHQLAAIAFKTRGFEDFHRGEAGPDAQRRTSQRPQCQTRQSQQRDLHTFFVSGNSLVVCHGRRNEVQWCAENERRIGVHLRCANCASEAPHSGITRPGGR